MSEYLKSILQILDYGLKTNSYKFALLRALADYGQEGAADELVTRLWLAERFVEYYWALTLTFRVRQATDPSRDPVIMRFIRQESAELGLLPNCPVREFRKKHPMNYAALLKSCCDVGGCFDEVIPRFHNVHRGHVRALLYDSGEDGLRLKMGVADFLKDYSRTLQLLAIGGWVRFTEQFTTAPRLYEKIAGLPPERKQYRYRRFLSQCQEQCFYCAADDLPLDVEHVIPWSFVLEDRIWNLLLACQKCNGTKGDRVPHELYLPKLRERNVGLLKLLASGSLAASDLRDVRRDLQEFASRDLDVHIRMLVDACREDGFGVWDRTPT